MAGLVGLGQQIKKEAKAGLLDVARQEASNQIVEEQMAQAKAASDASLYGTAIGIGGAYGASTAVGTGTAAATTGQTLAAAGPYAAAAVAVAFLLNKLFG
jgi:hypothetical protein